MHLIFEVEIAMFGSDLLFVSSLRQTLKICFLFVKTKYSGQTLLKNDFVLNNFTVTISLPLYPVSANWLSVKNEVIEGSYLAIVT